MLEDVGDYVIPKVSVKQTMTKLMWLLCQPDCCGKLLTIEANGMIIMGHPMQIQGIELVPFCRV